MAQQTAVLGRMVLVLEREGMSLRTDGGTQQEQDEYNPPVPARPSCHGNYYTKVAPPALHQTFMTSSACNPLGPCLTSNSTSEPSSRVL